MKRIRSHVFAYTESTGSAIGSFRIEPAYLRTLNASVLRDVTLFVTATLQFNQSPSIGLWFSVCKRTRSDSFNRVAPSGAYSENHLSTNRRSCFRPRSSKTVTRNNSKANMSLICFVIGEIRQSKSPMTCSWLVNVLPKNDVMTINSPRNEVSCFEARRYVRNAILAYARATHAKLGK